MTTARLEVESRFSGPLPPPELLARYDEIVPGMADRLMTTFEKQADHRMKLEMTVISGDTRRAWWGLVLAFVFGMVLLGASVYMIANGFEVAGIIVIVTELATLGGSLVYSTYTRRQERRSKRD